MTMPGFERRALAFETLTVSNAAGGLGPTAATSINATAAFFGPVETADVRWRADGTAPSASVGHLLPTGKTLYLEGDAARKVLFIRTGGADATVPVTYYQ